MMIIIKSGFYDKTYKCLSIPDMTSFSVSTLLAYGNKFREKLAICKHCRLTGSSIKLSYSSSRLKLVKKKYVFKQEKCFLGHERHSINFKRYGLFKRRYNPQSSRMFFHHIISGWCRSGIKLGSRKMYSCSFTIHMPLP